MKVIFYTHNDFQQVAAHRMLVLKIRAMTRVINASHLPDFSRFHLPDFRNPDSGIYALLRQEGQAGKKTEQWNNGIMIKNS